ncbi:MAG TPA: DsbA family protein [Dictyobacter sp.]|jgi:predicted DsbA family dithiol-disulfide isomerase|nr:DsbA family protein [Dictyobacter sp.]
MAIKEAAATNIQFHTDPRCPFAWRTALWAREARKVRPLTITWRIFSLEVVNRKEGVEADYVNGGGWPALRTLALARRLHGNEGFEKLYVAIGNAIHGRKEDMQDLGNLAAVAQAAGFPSSIVEQAMADDSTIQDVLKDHQEALDRYQAIGVPTIALDGSDIGFFGPVIVDVPQGEEAGELWDYTAWSLTQPNLFEMKRTRLGGLKPVFAQD